MACLIFHLFTDRALRKRNVLNDLLKRLRDIYIPGRLKKNRDSDMLQHFGGNSYTMSVENIDENTRKIHLKQKNMTVEEKKFEKLLKDINDVLFYLSNVQVQKESEEGLPPSLRQPIEVVLSIEYIFQFSEDLDKQFRGSFGNIINDERFDTDGSLTSSEINVLLPPKMNRTSSVDYVVIDDPADPLKKNQIKIKIENNKSEQMISITNRDH